ncbi:PREDICTED: palmitoyltransferase ZDHHC15-like [Amphimedon queenslandica]|uniref:Palmitoyltransferase n=1 Tax=Amphimedon queenslandica TaxID=400682 RepID=A0A1X7VMF7_AMPQE|nr:PREDICTED: palmitoyltransferase ZDHHC15-like [Amphimedon queenslandica]|eukprot:XP_019863089.1 PREDICTED: palmitoyltransferase ZDHHC15-like [Amphimedon queenslandica]
MAGFLEACQHCCYYCLRGLYWVPVGFVVLILTWGYYVYVYTLHLSGEFVKPIPVSVLFLFIGHILLFLHVSSYARTILTKHKPVPSEFMPTDEQLDQMDTMEDSQPFIAQLASSLPLNQVTRSGSVRYCAHCELIKPDRTHHCSTCGTCILKMDHHCPWVNNCVGFSNYKYFYLFLFYTVVLSLWFCLSSLYDIVHLWRKDLKEGLASKFNVTFCFVILGVFGLSTSCLLFFHTYLIFTNKTTIESMDAPRTHRGPVKDLYYLGVRRNLRAIFGSNPFLALLPVNTSEGNGASFPIKNHHHIAEYRSQRTGRTDTNNMENGYTVVLTSNRDSGSESEVEIFAVDDRRTETVPLASSPQ